MGQCHLWLATGASPGLSAAAASLPATPRTRTHAGSSLTPSRLSTATTAPGAWRPSGGSASSRDASEGGVGSGLAALASGLLSGTARVAAGFL